MLWGSNRDLLDCCATFTSCGLADSLSFGCNYQRSYKQCAGQAQDKLSHCAAEFTFPILEALSVTILYATRGVLGLSIALSMQSSLDSSLQPEGDSSSKRYPT